MTTTTQTDPHSALATIRDRLEAHQHQRQTLQERLDNTPVAGDSPEETRALQQQAAQLRTEIAGLDQAIDAIAAEEKQALAAVKQSQAAEKSTRDRVVVSQGEEEMRLLAELLERQRAEMIETLYRIKAVVAKTQQSWLDLQQNPDPERLLGWRKREFLAGVEKILMMPMIAELDTSPGGFELRHHSHDLLAEERAAMRRKLYGSKS